MAHLFFWLKNKVGLFTTVAEGLVEACVPLLVSIVCRIFARNPAEKHESCRVMGRMFSL